MVPEASEVLLSTSLADQLDLLGSKLESHGPKVITQSLLLRRSSDGNNILINTVTQADLSSVDGVLLRQTSKDIVGGSGSCLRGRGKRAVRFGRDALLLVVIQQIRVLKVGMEFDLVQGGWDGCSLQDDVKVFREEVRNTDTTSKSGLLDLLHGFPSLLDVFRAIAEERGVDQIHVNVIKLKLLQAGLNSSRNIFDVGKNFCRHEKLGAIDTTLLDSLSKLGFGLVDYVIVSTVQSSLFERVLVTFGTIEMVIAQADGSLGGIYTSLIELALVSGLVPSSTGTVAKLSESIRCQGLPNTEGHSPSGWSCHHSASGLG